MNQGLDLVDDRVGEQRIKDLVAFFVLGPADERYGDRLLSPF